MSDLKFRCLTTEDTQPMINAIAFEMNADVQYVHGRLNVLSVHMLGEHIGFIPISGRNYATLKATIGNMLDEC